MHLSKLIQLYFIICKLYFNKPSSNYMVWKTNKQTNTVHFSLHSGNLTRHRAISFAEVTDPAVTTDARGSEGETQPTRRTK